MAKKQRFWVREVLRLREAKGEENLIYELRYKDREWFHTYFRMNPAQFDEILGLVATFIQRNSHHRKPIPKQVVVIVCGKGGYGVENFPICDCVKFYFLVL